MDTPYQNPLAIRAKKLMTEAFFNLLRENPAEKIKITQLCERAGIARRTFYTHFDRIEDIPRKFLTDQWLTTLEEKNRACLDKDLPPENEYDFMVLTMYEYWGKRAECVSLLIEAGFRAVFFDVLYAGREFLMQLVGNHLADHHNLSNPIISKYSKSFDINTFINLYSIWLETGMKQSAQEMAEIHTTYVPVDIFQKLSKRFGDSS